MVKEFRTLPVIQPSSNPTPNPKPIFQKVAVVGLGLIGGSIALAARKIWPSCMVIGVDEKSVLEKAMVLHAIDVAADDLVVLAEADLVILAAPVLKNIELLDVLVGNVKGEAVVTDVGSTKRTIVETAKKLPSRITFIGGHPLAGAPRSGIEFSRADLFFGRPWLLTPVNDAIGPAVERLYGFIEGLGAKPKVIGVDEHDILLSFVSHLPQLTSSALMHVIGAKAGDSGLALSGRGLDDVTRLASSPSEIWRDICSTNADKIAPALDELITELQKIREGLNSGETIDRIFRSASSWRERLSALRRTEAEK